MRLENAELYSVAAQLDAAADLIDGAVARHLARLTFDGTRSGRAYPAAGDAVRSGLQHLAGDLAQWSRATAEIAVALRAGVEKYADAERFAAARIA